MAGRVTLDLTMREFKDLADYLLRHEDDIARDINDFGDLRGVFFSVYEEDPRED